VSGRFALCLHFASPPLAYPQTPCLTPHLVSHIGLTPA